MMQPYNFGVQRRGGMFMRFALVMVVTGALMAWAVLAVYGLVQLWDRHLVRWLAS